MLAALESHRNAAYEKATCRYGESWGAVNEIVSVASEQNAAASQAERASRVEAAVQAAREAVLAQGVAVSKDMLKAAEKQAAMFSKKEDTQQLMLEKAQKCLLVEAALEAACSTASAEFSCKQKEYARLSAATSESMDFEVMQEKAAKALSSHRQTYTVSVCGYSKAGVEVKISFLTIGGASFDIQVPRGTSVRDVAHAIKDVKQLRGPAYVEGLEVEVKLIGPAGTVLQESRCFPEVIDYETDGAGEEAYPEAAYLHQLEVLTGEAWKELGLDGPTRWKYVPEEDFVKLFGMSKASFDQLKPWTQNSLKKKHGLF